MYPSGQRDLPLIRKRRILERAAFTLFAGLEAQRQLTFTQESLVSALTQAAKLEDYSAPMVDAILDDCTANSGIIRGTPTEGYYFLYPSLQEFLTAGALARLVHDAGGWNALLEVQGRPCTVQELVNKKAWDPRWQEVIVLLSGQLHDPTIVLNGI